MSAPLSDEELDEIEQRAKAATPGPWVPGGTFGPGSDDVVAASFDGDWLGVLRCPNNQEGADAWRHNRPFVAKARTDVPALVAEVRRLRHYVFGLRDAVECYGWHVQACPAFAAEHGSGVKCDRSSCGFDVTYEELIEKMAQ